MYRALSQALASHNNIARKSGKSPVLAAAGTASAFCRLLTKAETQWQSNAKSGRKY